MLEKFIKFRKSEINDSLLHGHEIFWTKELGTAKPSGFNDEHEGVETLSSPLCEKGDVPMFMACLTNQKNTHLMVKDIAIIYIHWGKKGGMRIYTLGDFFLVAFVKIFSSLLLNIYPPYLYKLILLDIY